MRKLVRVSVNALWALASIVVTVLLSNSSWLSNDSFVRMMEVNGIMLGAGSFVYGLFFGRAPVQ